MGTTAAACLNLLCCFVSAPRLRSLDLCSPFNLAKPTNPIHSCPQETLKLRERIEARAERTPGAAVVREDWGEVLANPTKSSYPTNPANPTSCNPFDSTGFTNTADLFLGDAVAEFRSARGGARITRGP
jgi:hypothetical protein